MEIKIKGRLKGGKVVVFGKSRNRFMQFLRRATMFRWGGTSFSLSVPLPPAGINEFVKLPGPLDAMVTASLIDGRVRLSFNVVTDALGLVVQSFEFNDNIVGQPQKFSLKAFGAEVEGTVELV